MKEEEEKGEEEEEEEKGEGKEEGAALGDQGRQKLPGVPGHPTNP